MPLRTICFLALCWTAPLLSQTPPPDLFSPDRVARIEIKLAPEDWKALRISHPKPGGNWFELNAPYEYYKADVTIDGVLRKQVSVRKKGFVGSAVSTRPSLKIKFGDLDLMTLNNNNQDPSQMHQFLAYDFFRRAGAAAPRASFAHVIVNGENLGVYTHVESIGKAFLQRQFGNSNGLLYEGSTGDFTEAEFARIEEKDGAKNQDRSKITELKKLLLSPGPLALAEVEKLVDVSSFLKFWTAEVLIGHWDGYSKSANNFYLYLDAKTNRFHFIPWGMDMVFRPQPVPKSVEAGGKLCERLWELPEIRARYKSEMLRLLAGPWDEKRMTAEMQRVESLLAGLTTVPPEPARQNVEAIRTFLRDRRGEVQKELDAAPNWPAVSPRVPMGEEFSSDRLQITGTFTAPWGAAPGNPFQSGKVELQITLDGKAQPAAFTRFGASSGPTAPGLMRDGYASITILAGSEDWKKTWIVMLILDPHQIPAQKGEMDVDFFTVAAVLIEQSAQPKQRIFGVSGKLQLNEVATKAGETMSGTFLLKTAPF
jgi:hypothetical protein